MNETKKRMVLEGVLLAIKRLNPFYLARNPVMFVVFIGGILTTLIFLRDCFFVVPSQEPLWFTASISFWIWFTVIFANTAEAIAEGKGKAHASSLKVLAQEIIARRLLDDGSEELVQAPELRRDDRVRILEGEFIPADGEIIEGIASIDESAITGESAPVVRESESDMSSVIAGTRVLSNSIIIRITSNPGESFLDQMIHLVLAARRQKTPNEIAVQILLIGLTFIFLIVCSSLIPLGIYSKIHISMTIIIALLVCLIPTTIGGLISAIGISGIERALKKNILAMSGKAVETAGDVDVLLLDKTGTITHGNRMPVELYPDEGVDIKDLAKALQLSSYADHTPEGRSILEFITQNYGNFITNEDIKHLSFIPFSAETRMSGCDIEGYSIRKGACDSIRALAEKMGLGIPATCIQLAEEIGRKGGTPLAVVDNRRVLGLVYLKDVVKPGIRERFQRLRAMGVRTIMITGDNPFTAQTIAEEAGVDTFLAEATPENKMNLIRQEQMKGFLVAMTGDGTNDAPALAQADLGIAMASGTQAAKEAANMVDLDSNPTKIIEVIEIGKQLLMTRGCLTTFSIANDVAKYFAIIPALFIVTTPEMHVLNIMGLGSPYSAVLSTVIFNALIIVALIPLALKGVKYRPMGVKDLLARSLFIYGGGGILIPFVGIKVIDTILAYMGLV